MECVYKRPETLFNRGTPYCPGCYHALTQKLIAEVIDEMGIREKTVYASAIGCNGLGQYMANYDSFGSLHGRASAAAAGAKMFCPDSVFMVYQGDGDAASIGTAETIHTARRGDPVTIIFANNTLYGMTGGQVAPTTREGQKTTTTPEGSPYKPIHMAEIVAQLDAPYFVTRCAVHTPKNIIKFKKAVKDALTYQIENQKYSFIEVLCACPTSGGVKPEDTPKYMEEIMIPEFPLGDLKRDGKRL